MADSATNLSCAVETVERFTIRDSGQDQQSDGYPPPGVYVPAAAFDDAMRSIGFMQASLSAPEAISAAPAETYEPLRKQFLALRALANSNAKMVSYWRGQCGRETRETLLANAASVNAERETNAILTDELERAEQLCTDLRQQRDDMATLLRDFRKGAVLSPANLDRIDALLAAAGQKP